MNKKRHMQLGIAAVIVSILLMSGNIFVLGQMQPDTIAPSVTITQPTVGANLNTSNVVVAGSATDNVGVTSVEILLDNIPQGNAAINLPNGVSVSWSMTLLVLAQGPHTVTAKARDGANNIQSANVNFVIDTARPAILAPLPITVQANTAGGALKTHPTIATFLNGAFALDIIDSTLTITNNALNLFPLGITTVTFTATDDAGNSASDSSTVTVIDTTLPSVSITQPVNGSKISSSTVTITGTVNNPSNVQSVKLSIDGGSPKPASLNATSGIWKFGPIALAEGIHTAKATVTNSVNNNATTVASFIVDTVQPLISIVSPANNATLTTTSVKVNGTASDTNGVASVVVSIDGGQAKTANLNVNTGKWTFQTTLTNGTHTIKATATDMAGNKTMASISVRVSSTQGNQPPIPTEGGFNCNGKQFRGKLKLEDTTATFINCEIRGSVRIEDSTVVFENSTVRGNMKVEDSDLKFESSELRGNIHMEGGSLVLQNNMIRGNVKVCGTEMTQIANNIVKGSIKVCEDEGSDEANSGQSTGSTSFNEKENSGKGKGGDKGKDSDKGEKDGKGKGKLGKGKNKGHHDDD